MSLNDWLTAFLLTQAFEVPIYGWMARTLSGPRRAAYALGASTITHPLIWFCLPWQTGPYVMLLIAAELFAVVIEAFWGRLLSVPRYWKASVVANATSLCVGSAVRWMLP